MKLPHRHLQRLAVAVAVSALAAAGISAVAIVTQPASSNSGYPDQSVRLVEPASDEPTTTVTEAPTLVTMAEEILAAPDRAEKAAERAEVAAGRAEVAATKAEAVITATTTTRPSTSTTTGGRPILVGVIEPLIPTTTTTVAKKTWVKIASFPVATSMPTEAAPLLAEVELQTGQLRVSGLPRAASIFQASQLNAVWLADASPAEISQCNMGQSPQGGKVDVAVEGSDCWPTGKHTIAAGSFTSPIGTPSMENYRAPRWTAPFGSRWNEGGIVIEEYR